MNIKQIMNQKKSWITRLVFLCGICISIMASPMSFAGKEQGSSNGQPFQTLQELMAQEIAASEAKLMNEVDCINDYLNGTSNAVGPCPDYSSSSIEELKTDVDQLQSDLAELQGKFDDADCPPGYSLRDLDPVICEEDDDTNDQLQRFSVAGSSVLVPLYSFRSAYVYCPADYHIAGCGFNKSSYVIDILSAHPYGNGCRIRAYGRSGQGYVIPYANCARAFPLP